MAQKIRIRRSALQGNAPTTAQLDLGELALNTFDGKLYTKKNQNGTESIIEISGASVSASDNLPANPNSGALWYDSVGGRLYVYYNDGSTSQWVDASPPAGNIIADKIEEGNTRAEVIDTGSDGRFVVTIEGTDSLTCDSLGRLLVNTSTPSGPAILQVQTPTTLSTTNNTGVSFVNASTKTYPTTASFAVTPGLTQNIELGTAQVIDTVTPGGFNFVYGTRLQLTKSAGNTQDIERLYFSGFSQAFNWADSNTCKQYVGIGDSFSYSGINANGRTTSYVEAFNVYLIPPAGGTQTIANAVCFKDLTIIPADGSTVNITNSFGVLPSLSLRNSKSGTKTINISNHSFFETSQFWGTSGTSGTLNATITNLFALRLRPPISSTGLTITNNWGVYQEWSSAKNWFAGASNQFPNVTTTASGANAFLDSADSNRLYLSTSSITYKRDVENLDSTFADRILDLRPVWYRSKCKDDCQDWSWYGLIAEEVAEVDPRFVHFGYQDDAYEFVEVNETVELPLDDPRREQNVETENVTRNERRLKSDAQRVPNGVAYERLVVPLLDIIKRQKNQLEMIEARISALEAK